MGIESQLVKTEYGYKIQQYINGRDCLIKYMKKENYIQLLYGTEKYPYPDEDNADEIYHITNVPGTEYFTIVQTNAAGGRLNAATWCSTGDIISRKGIAKKAEQDDMLSQTSYLCMNLYFSLRRANSADKVYEKVHEINKIVGKA